MRTSAVGTLLPLVSLERIFRTSSRPRDKFLSRLLGLFGEEIVRLWAAQDGAPYRDLGRPTLWVPDGSGRSTLDFTFESRASGDIFVAEMKCELEFENYRYLTLTANSQLSHHQALAFRRFLAFAREPNAFVVKVNAKPVAASGAILAWGAVTAQGRLDVQQTTGISDVLSLENMIGDLQAWGVAAYEELLAERAAWCGYLFESLRGQR
jgi:hypothetical protein